MGKQSFCHQCKCFERFDFWNTKINSFLKIAPYALEMREAVPAITKVASLFFIHKEVLLLHDMPHQLITFQGNQATSKETKRRGRVTLKCTCLDFFSLNFFFMLILGFEVVILAAYKVVHCQYYLEEEIMPPFAIWLILIVPHLLLLPNQLSSF